MTAQQLISEVKNRLAGLDARLRFDVVEAGVRQDDEWWYVPVIPEMSDGRLAARDFSVNVLAGVETKLHSDLGINVLFIPATR
jgi:hypothetical protein